MTAGSHQDGTGAVAFGEKLIALLDTGSFTTSYKYAVLLALLDETLEHVDTEGWAPRTVSGRQVARRVFALYWDQARPFSGASPLRQSRQRDLVVKAAELRTRLGVSSAISVREASRRYPDEVAAVQREVEATVLRYPIPLLQRLGDGSRAVEHRFIYEYGWEPEVSPAWTWHDDFDDRLTFVGDAGDHLVALAGLIRPLVERQWVDHVARRNPAEVDDLRLSDYLFGSERLSLQRLAGPLRELQGGACFYCGRTRGPWEVDHFLAWSRWADDSLDNLVVADRSCNNAKRAALAGLEPLGRWYARIQTGRGWTSDLNRLAEEADWYRRPDAARSVARALYLRQPAGTALWTPAGVELLDVAVVREIFAEDIVDAAAEASGSFSSDKQPDT